MIIRRVFENNPCISRMFSQLSFQWVSPVVFEKSLIFQKNPPFSLEKNRFFCDRRPAQIANLSLSVSSPSSNITTASRISRVARTEAQGALFDYLHFTRNLNYNDAEHICKNSPTFLQNLLSKIENEQEISRSLSRFLRYNPINEFEPFFESLGLTPSELSLILPRNLIFLSDDDILLENVHVLCNYGIRRSNIGKMYKEETEIFRYDSGVLATKLKAYELLGLSKPTVIKLVMCCPSLFIGGVNTEFVRFLDKLKGMTIEIDWIREYVLDKSTCDWKRMLDMIHFLGKMGYSKADMGRLFVKHPGFLFEGSGKKTYIVVALLFKLGLKRNDVLFLFQQQPQILAGNFAKNLWEAVHFLSEIGMETEDITEILCTHTQLLGSCSLKKSRTVLSHLKMRPDRLCEIIKDDPLKLSSLASQSKVPVIDQVAGKDKRHKLACDEARHIIEKTTFLLRLGYVEDSDEMMKAAKQFRGRGDQLQERFDCLVNAGLDCNIVCNMIKVAPPVLNQTKDVIEKKIDYLVNHLGYPLQSLVAFPTYLCYDLERIKLRFSMYVWLRKKGVAKSMLALSTILACSDARFEKYFVNIHLEGPITWESLKKSSPS